MAAFDELDKTFEIESSKIVSAEEPRIEALVTLGDNDEELASATLRDLIAKGAETVDGITDLAKQTDSPRAYEVAGQLIKTLADIAGQLVDVKKKKIDMAGENSTKIGTQNNNVFVGSTTDLMKMLKDKKLDGQ